jgi:hypothetical protein
LNIEFKIQFIESGISFSSLYFIICTQGHKLPRALSYSLVSQNKDMASSQVFNKNLCQNIFYHYLSRPNCNAIQRRLTCACQHWLLLSVADRELNCGAHIALLLGAQCTHSSYILDLILNCLYPLANGHIIFGKNSAMKFKVCSSTL